RARHGLGVLASGSIIICDDKHAFAAKEWSKFVTPLSSAEGTACGGDFRFWKHLLAAITMLFTFVHDNHSRLDNFRKSIQHTTHANHILFPTRAGRIGAVCTKFLILVTPNLIK